MREIKYKIRDKLNNEWIEEGIEFFLSPDGYLWFYNRHTQKHEILNTPEDYKVIFYTGLKDKNGDEIFEGDIVRAAYEATICLPAYESIGVVRWGVYNDNEYVYTLETWVRVDENNETLWPISDLGGTYGQQSHDLEVIGNIHENPELLTNKEK